MTTLKSLRPVRPPRFIVRQLAPASWLRDGGSHLHVVTASGVTVSACRPDPSHLWTVFAPDGTVSRLCALKNEGQVADHLKELIRDALTADLGGLAPTAT